MVDLKISIANLNSGDIKPFSFFVPQKAWHLPEEQVQVVAPLEIDGTLAHAGDFYVLKAQVSTRLKLECTRCLANFEEDFLLNIEEELRRVSSEDRLDELEPEDSLYSTFTGQQIDLREIVMEHMVIGLPIKRLCREDCKGLCPTCGEDKNVTHCQCEEESIDPRLQALKQLLKDNN